MGNPNNLIAPLTATRIIELEALTIAFIDDVTVLVRAKPEVTIDFDKAKETNELIQDSMPGDYGMIIDREADYSIMPVEVFGVLNKIEKLKAIAIVAHRNSSLTTAKIDKLLFKKQLDVFFSLTEAHRWIQETLDASTPSTSSTSPNTLTNDD